MGDGGGLVDKVVGGVLFKGVCVYFGYGCESFSQFTLCVVHALWVCVCVHVAMKLAHLILFISGFWMKNGATQHKFCAILCTGA